MSMAKTWRLHVGSVIMEFKGLLMISPYGIGKPRSLDTVTKCCFATTYGW